MPRYAVAHHAGVIFVPWALLHLLPLLHLCGIIGNFLSPCPNRAGELSRREIDPNE
jgi:hypothetical protein